MPTYKLLYIYQEAHGSEHQDTHVPADLVPRAGKGDAWKGHWKSHQKEQEGGLQVSAHPSPLLILSEGELRQERGSRRWLPSEANSRESAK